MMGVYDKKWKVDENQYEFKNSLELYKREFRNMCWSLKSVEETLILKKIIKQLPFEIT